MLVLVTIDSYLMCDCSVRVTAILEYIESVVPLLYNQEFINSWYNVSSAFCEWFKTSQEDMIEVLFASIYPSNWGWRLANEMATTFPLANFACTRGAISMGSMPVQYLYRSNVVVFKCAAQGMCCHGKLSPLCGIAAWRRTR